MDELTIVAVIVFGVLFGAGIIAAIVSQFLTTVDAGSIRLISWWKGGVNIYKGPGKAIEVPLLTTAATIPSQAINIDLDITDQTSDRDSSGVPRPIKVNVQASAIVAVGDSDVMILTAANRFFSKSGDEQLSTLTDLLTSAGRRAINLLRHDQLFSALTGPMPESVAVVPTAASALTLAGAPIDDEDEDPLAVIIKRQCSRELHDLGLTFKSLNIKVVISEVAEARRRQSAVQAKAEADIVTAEQERRAQEARLQAASLISDKERELERRRAENAAEVARAEALKQDALAIQRTAELKATQLAQALADAERAKVEAIGRAEAERDRQLTAAEGEVRRAKLLAEQAKAEAERVRIEAAGRAEAERARLVTIADGEAQRARLMAEGEAQAEKFRLETIASGEAERIRTLAEAQAEAITKVSEAMARGGESYLRVRQLELLPQIAPSIAGALANARLINVSNTGNAASGATEQITAVLQTMLTAQLLKDGLGSSPASTELAESDRS